MTILKQSRGITQLKQERSELKKELKAEQNKNVQLDSAPEALKLMKKTHLQNTKAKPQGRR